MMLLSNPITRALLAPFASQRQASPKRHPAKPRPVVRALPGGRLTNTVARRLLQRGVKPSQIDVTSVVAIARRGAAVSRRRAAERAPVVRQAEPMSNVERRTHYYAQNGTDRHLTAAQRRRYDHKIGHRTAQLRRTADA